MNYLDFVVASHRFGRPLGIPSICSAHPAVIEAALRYRQAYPRPLLIEATSNQVNPFGGYTGMTPADFARLVGDMADAVGFPRRSLILGGDHLGPLPWSDEPAARAMEKAKEMVRACVQAGFVKLHLDCSMACADDSDLPVERVAARTAELAQTAEETAAERNDSLRYVIGTEVPPAGGARSGEPSPTVTDPAAVAETIEQTRRAFSALGLERAWERVVAVVVQPGVEFGDEAVHEYDPSRATGLARFIESVPGMVYEAHSTDYQPRSALRALVEDHFGILKVGPALTFAYREAVFALAMMEAELVPAQERSHLIETLDTVMREKPVHWRRYYSGSEREQAFKRRYSRSDRIRYYWAEPRVQAAVGRLLDNIGSRPLPFPLVSQFAPYACDEIRRGSLPASPSAVIYARIREVLEDYDAACDGGPGSAIAASF